MNEHPINLIPEWIHEFVEVTTIVPGAQSGPGGPPGYIQPVRTGLTLYRCLRCWALVEDAGRPIHASFHAWIQRIVP